MDKVEEKISVEQGNKLIVEFMGAEFDMGHYHVTDSYTKKDGEHVFKYQQGTAFYDEGKEPSYRKGGYPITTLEYHSSWDWLMPVVEKTEGLFVDKRPVIVDISGSGACIYLNKYKAYGGYGEQPNKEIANTLNYNYFHDTPDDVDRLTKIEAVWLAVVEFIKWYNQNKNADTEDKNIR